MNKRLPRCLHCGSLLPINRNRFCSAVCESEDTTDRVANLQRINTFQALSDAGTWLRIHNVSIRSLTGDWRKVTLLEKRHFSLGKHSFISYRLTPAGYKLLARWKAQLQIFA